MKKLTVAAMMLGLLSAPAHADEFPPNFLSRSFSGASAQQQVYAHGGHGRHHGRRAHAWSRAQFARYAQPQYAPQPEASTWQATSPDGGRSFVARASYYGGGPRRFEPNSHTANGERFDQWGLTAAHRSLPMGTRLLVSHAGRSVVVRVNDRGPAAWTGRSLDVSRGAAARLGLIGPGTGAVHVTVLGRG